MKTWVKICLGLVAWIVLSGIGILMYSKYVEYEFNEELKEIIRLENKLEANKVINKYNDLIKKYTKNDKGYLALSNFYLKIGDLSQSVKTIYIGEEKSKDKPLFKSAMEQRVNGIVLEKGYMNIIKGSNDKIKEDVVVSTESGQSLELKVDSNNSVLDRNKEGWYDLVFKEKLTGKQIPVDVEVGEYHGNTMGNNFNGGRMLYKDGYIYYVEPSGNSIYKMKEDLTDKKEIIKNVEASFLNVKNDNLYFIDRKEGQYGGLIKTDLDGNNRTVVQQSCDSAYIIGDSIYCDMVDGEKDGWALVHLNAIDLNGKVIKEKIAQSRGYIKTINSNHFCTVNQNGCAVTGDKNQSLWGDWRTYKNILSIGEYKGVFYGTASDMNSGSELCTIDIDNNSQKSIVKNVERSVLINGKIYYVKDNSVFVRNVDKDNDKKIIDYKPGEFFAMYNINGQVFLYSKDGIINLKGESICVTPNSVSTPPAVKKESEKVTPEKNNSNTNTPIPKKNETTSNNGPDIKNEEIIDMANKANKLIYSLTQGDSSKTVRVGGTAYFKVKAPYSTMDSIRKEFSKYFTKNYVENNMKIFKDINGEAYVIMGNVGDIAGYTYDSIKSRANKGDRIELVSYAKNTDYPGEAQDDGQITMKLENGKWKIENFFNVVGL